MSSTAPKQVRVVAGLFHREGTVLVQQRPPGKARALLWEFPGGKVEVGETDVQALMRECREELGIAATIGKRVWHTVHRYADLVVELLLLEAWMPADVQPQALDAHHLAWVRLASLEALPFCEADHELVADLIAGKIPLPG